MAGVLVRNIAVHQVSDAPQRTQQRADRATSRENVLCVTETEQVS